MCSTVAGLLAGVAGVPVDAPVDPVELIELRRLADRVQALYLARLARFDAAGECVVDGTGRSWVWLREQAGALPAEARAEVWLARRLHGGAGFTMPGTQAALAAGRLTVGQARLIAQGLSRLPAERAEQMEATVAEQVAALGPAASTRICQHLVAIGEDETRAGKAEAARAARHLHVRPVGGMLAVDGLLAPAQAGPLLTALDAYSQPVPAGPDGIPDPRTAGQRKADALGEIASVVLDRGAPSVGGLRPHLQLVLHLDAAAAAPDPTGPDGQNNPDGPAQPYGPAGRSGPAGHPGEPRDPVQPNGPAGRSGTSGGDWAGETGYPSYPGYPSEAQTGPLRRDELEQMSCDAEVSWLAVRDPQPGHPPDAPRPADHRPDDHRPADRRPGDHPPDGQPPDGGAAGRAGGPVLTSPTGLPLYRWIIAAIRAALPPALGGSSPDILAAGRSIRLVPPHIRRALNVRDQGCVHPGCDRPPARCHAHHIRHWLHGGPTDLDNLVLACAYHHQHWHREHLKPVRQPDGNWQIHPDPHAAASHQHGHARGRHAA